MSGVHYRFNSQAKKIQYNRAGRRRVSPTFGFRASLEVGPGATVGTLQTRYLYILCNTAPCLPAKVGSRAATCPVAPDPVSLPGWALVPRMCTVAPDPASLLGMAPVIPSALWLHTLPPCREGSDAAMRPAIPCGPWDSSIKEPSYHGPMWLGLRVYKACTHVSKVPDVRASIGLQDVRAGNAFNACKTYKHASTV
jgi:hypothetical protein